MLFVRIDQVQSLAWDSQRGETLRSARNGLGYSQDYLAEKLRKRGNGCSRQFVQFLERGGQGSIKPQLLVDITEVLGVPIEEFYATVEVKP